MYQNAKLKNSYTFAYVMWLFGSILIPLLFIKVGLAMVIIFEVIACASLGLLIASHTLYLKDYKLFSYLGLGGVATYTLVTLSGLIFEFIMLVTKNNGGNYIWFILILLIASTALLDVFFTLDFISHKKNIKNESEGE